VDGLLRVPQTLLWLLHCCQYVTYGDLLRPISSIFSMGFDKCIELLAEGVWFRQVQPYLHLNSVFSSMSRCQRRALPETNL
jgi:hypothetical protein